MVHIYLHHRSKSIKFYDFDLTTALTYDIIIVANGEIPKRS